MGIIYKITNPSKNVYVGKTELTFEKRLSDYKCNRFNSKKSYIKSSIKKYGFDAHVFEIIEIADNSILSEREIYWIDKLKTYAYEHKNGMNLTKGGDGQRHSWKKDKERVAKAKLRCGKNAPMYGKTISKESRKKISESLKRYKKENNIKFPNWVKELSRKKLCKSVVCYDSNGNFIGEYESIVNAAKSLGVNRRTAVDAVNGKQTHVNGFIIRHKTENYALKIDVGILNKRPIKKPVICLKDSNQIKYRCSDEASLATGIKKWKIVECCLKNNKKPTKEGYVFLYEDNYLETSY